ncbi:MAG: UDP-N-acetylmuramate dehydrogenase [Candidatus Omnitrophota bacterium]
MLNKGTRERLLKICESGASRVIFDEPLCEHSTIAIGGKVLAWVRVSSPEDLVGVNRALKSVGARSIVVGNCSNMLFPDSVLDAAILELTGEAFRKLDFDGGTACVGAGVMLADLISYCCDRGLSGMEGLVGIPATVGGALANNASYLSSVSDRLVSVRVLDRGLNAEWIEKEDIEFGYRYSSLKSEGTILEAVFKLEEGDPAGLKQRLKKLFLDKKEKQPLGKKTLGCVFKNPDEGDITSGEIIDKAGMKGSRVGGAIVSVKHANFIENAGGASAADVCSLITKVKSTVKEKFEVELEPEIEIIK